MVPESAIVPRLLNPQQVAAYLDLSIHTIYKFVSQRKIPHIKIGKLLKFDRQEIDRWITRNSVKPLPGLERSNHS